MMKPSEVLDNLIQQQEERYKSLCSRIIDVEKVAHERISKVIKELTERIETLENYMHKHDARIMKLEDTKLDVLE